MRNLLAILFLVLLQPAAAQITDKLKTNPDTELPPPPPPPSTQQVPTVPAQEPPRQRRDSRPFIQRLDFGLGSAFWITGSQTYVELAPVLAYRFPKTLITGMGYRYIYRHDRVFGKDLNAYGPNFFARANLTQRIYLWTEYEILKTDYIVQAAGYEVATQSINTYSAFAGLGYIRSFRKSGRGGISFQVLYNFLYDREDYNPYYSPVIYRVGYYF